jgi:hypothetical protein
MADAVRRREARKADLAARAGPAAPGDVFLFHGPAPVALRWAVVLTHPDRPLLFAVPADTNPLAGTADVTVPPSAPGGPMVLHCGHGLWIHQDDFPPGLRVARLEDRFLRRAQDKLAEVARGRVEGTAGQRETDALPAYDDWVGEVARAADVLADTLRRRERVVPVQAFRRDVLPGPVADPDAEDAAEPRHVLAAAPALHELLAVAPGEAPPAWPVAYAYPGHLFLVLEEGGVGARYMPTADQAPPELHQLLGDGPPVAVAWKHTPNRKVYWALFPWADGHVALRFGSGEQAREITVRQ